MILYEVNIAVPSDLRSDFESWLKGHVERVVAAGKFTSGRIYSRVNDEEGEITNRRLLTVVYEIPNRPTLQAYLDGPSKEMRAETEASFGTKPVITRRILYSLF